eukprot:gb/GFBE01030469.1/.p1 GENE.gb/GFBE01030469.1/~~gb/GFBE01030469.1/.p1  ORF type:complete len:275 (+),score=62.68 gb/GFBE01030469.1/:1-825(+)
MACGGRAQLPLGLLLLLTLSEGSHFQHRELGHRAYAADGKSDDQRVLRLNKTRTSVGWWESAKQVMGWMMPPSIADGLGLLPSQVEVEFFVMSMCPDAKACEDVFLPVLRELAPLVNMNFTYIATLQDNSPVCMHGPAECAGDRQRLCVQKQVKSDGNASKLLDFASCQDSDLAAVPSNGQACARKAGVIASDFSSCSDAGGAGEALLVASAQRSSDLSIATSCTVRVQGEVFCVHNGDWEGCSSCDDDKAACLKTKVCNSVSSHGTRKSELCR